VIDEIQKCPYIQQSCSGQSLLDGGSMPWKNTRGGGDYISCRLVGLTPEYLTLYGLKLKEGRFFDLEKDKDREEKVVLNETALKMFGFTSLEEAELESQYWGKGWKVIGVVEDFRVDHLAVPIAPMIMVYFDDREDCPYQMQVTKGKEKEVISLLNTLYQKTQEPGELEYYFFEDEVRALYTKDKKMAEVTIIFTLLAIFISSIGLFGFAYFDIRQRFREIGIRKVNGATPHEILLLLFRRFIVLILGSFVVAVPIAWWVIEIYRENFIECASLAWWLFAAAFLITGGVAFFTLLWQSRKAALANPVKALKNE